MDISNKNKMFLNYYLFSDNLKVNENTPLICVDATDEYGTLTMITEDEKELIDRVLTHLTDRKGSLIITFDAKFFIEIMNVRYEFLNKKPLDFNWEDYNYFSIKDYGREQIAYAFGIEDFSKPSHMLQLCCDHDFTTLHNEVKKNLVLMAQIYKNIERQHLKKDRIIRMRIHGVNADFIRTDIYDKSFHRIENPNPKITARVDPVTGEAL